MSGFSRYAELYLIMMQAMTMSPYTYMTLSAACVCDTGTSKYGAFTPMWFAIRISSGGLALILNSPRPYRGRWKGICSSVLYVSENVLFVIFGPLMIARWIAFPHVALRRALSDPDELGAYAIPAIVLLTIASLTVNQVSEASWGGNAFTLVAYVLWWIGVACVFVTAVVVMVTLFYTGNQADRVSISWHAPVCRRWTMIPVIFMAPVELATAGAEAGFITIYGASMSARLAVPQLFVGYFAVGTALSTAIILYTVYFHRLLSSGWAPVAKRAGLFILIGPCGQLSTAFQLLGESANQYMRFARYKPFSVRPPSSGTFWTADTGRGVDGSGILVSLLLLGFDYFWLCIAFIGILDAFINHRKQVSYTLTWWAVVFPVVTLTTAWLERSNAMDSPTFRASISAMIVFIALTYFTNLGFTIHGVLTGKLLFGKTQREIEEGIEKKAQGTESLNPGVPRQRTA